MDIDESAIDDAPRKLLLVDRRKALTLGVTQDSIVNTLSAGLSGQDVTYLRDHSRFPVAINVRMNPQLQGDLDALLQLQVRSNSGELIRLSELMQFSDTVVEQPIYHKDLLPVNFVVADMAGDLDSPLYGMFKTRSSLSSIDTPDGMPVTEYFISQPDDQYRGYSIKWDGEWQITYETFRDMGLAYGVGLILIYLLVVAQFGSYLTPVIIMAPIPLTVIGVMPGHALLGAQFTATSMIGMIALAGIIVRNSILLVDFINLQVQCSRYQYPEDQRNGQTIKNRIIENKESTDHGRQTRQNNRLRTGNGTFHNRAFVLHSLSDLQVNKINQQDGVTHDNTGQRDHTDHAGGGELSTQQGMTRHHTNHG